VSGSSPRSVAGTIENDPILRTPGSEGDGDAFPFRRDSATSDDKPQDDVFVKPPIPDRLLKGKSSSKSPGHDDFAASQALFSSMYLSYVICWCTY
jgi:hypothetical protein